MWLVAGPTNQTLSLSMWTQSQATGRENPPARWFRKCRIPTPLSPAAWTSSGSINAHAQLLITRLILFLFYHQFLFLSFLFFRILLSSFTLLYYPPYSPSFSISYSLSPPFYPPLIFPLSPNRLSLQPYLFPSPIFLFSVLLVRYLHPFIFSHFFLFAHLISASSLPSPLFILMFFFFSLHQSIFSLSPSIPLSFPSALPVHLHSSSSIFFSKP